MKNYQKDFGPFNGRVWLNAASEGAIPKVSVEAAHEAVEWKRRPFEMNQKRFTEEPRRLKETVGKLLNVAAPEVILGNSASYGTHLFAKGIPLTDGDEVLLMQNDFPVDILPWLFLQKNGVKVRQLKPKGWILQPDEVFENISDSTKVVCLPHVHSFTGHILDIESIGNICRDKGVIFIVNLSQSCGYIPINIGGLPVDAFTTAAFKWLLGPYGTGFCWAKKELRDRLKYEQAYWGNILTPEVLHSEEELKLPANLGIKQYDVFGTANFFNFNPLRASIEYLLGVGIENVHNHVDELVGRLVTGLKKQNYKLISPEEKGERSALVVFTHASKERNKAIHQSLLEQEIYLALWKGNLRASPHLFNTPDEINRLVEALSKED